MTRIGISLLLFTLSSCASTSRVELRKVSTAGPEIGPGDVAFQLYLDKSIYTGDETVFAYGCLQNNSNKSLMVNSRMDWGYHSGGATESDIVIEVSPDRRPFVTGDSRRLLMPEDFVSLLPGERIYSRAIVISDINGLPSGTYKVRATYHNWLVPFVDGEQACCFPVWIGECRSNEVTFSKQP